MNKRLRDSTLGGLLALALALPAQAHQPDPVRQAERAGRWLDLDAAQVQQLAHFLTDTRLQRRQRLGELRAELLAVLSDQQKLRWLELRGEPRPQGDLEQRLAHWQVALNLSPDQLAQVRARIERNREQARQGRELRYAELERIVGVEQAQRIRERLAQRRAR